MGRWPNRTEEAKAFKHNALVVRYTGLGCPVVPDVVKANLVSSHFHHDGITLVGCILERADVKKSEFTLLLDESSKKEKKLSAGEYNKIELVLPRSSQLS